PLERRVLEAVETAPRAAVTHQLGLVETDHALDERVVIRITAGPDRGDRAVLGQPLRVADREVLHASVAVVHESPQVLVLVPGREAQAIDQGAPMRKPLRFVLPAAVLVALFMLLAARSRSLGVRTSSPTRSP